MILSIARAAFDLAIENRRREVFTKLKVRSVAELVTLVLRAEGGDF